MRRCRRRESQIGSRDESRGFILVVVLWMTVLMALMSVAFSKAVQSYIRETAQRTQAAEADLLADAGINLATLDLTMVRDGAIKTGRFVTAGNAVGCRAGEKGALFIRTQDAAGRVNINLANQNLLSALFIGLGVEPEAATRYAARIIDFRDRDSDRGPTGAELDDYLAQGQSIGPKNAAFESFEELAQVLGLPGDVVSLMLPHITIFSGVAGVDTKSASPQLLKILEDGYRRLPQTDGQGLGQQGLPDDVRMPSSRRFFTVTVSVLLPGGAVLTKAGDIDVSQNRGSLPTLRSMRRLPDAEKRDEVDLAALPKC